MATKTRITVYDNDLLGKDPYYDPTVGLVTYQMKGDKLNECLGFLLGGRRRGNDSQHNAAEAARRVAIMIAKEKTGGITKRAASVLKDQRMPPRTVRGRKPMSYSPRQIRRWLADAKKSGHLT